MDKVVYGHAAGTRCRMVVVAMCLLTGIAAFPQITVDGRMRLRQVGDVIKRQSAFTLFFLPGVAADSLIVTPRFRDKPVRKILDYCVKGYGYDYNIEGENIFIFRQSGIQAQNVPADTSKPLIIRILNSMGEPLPWASICTRRAGKPLMAVDDGSCLVPSAHRGDTIYISYGGYSNAEYIVPDTLPSTIPEIRLQPLDGQLDEVYVMSNMKTRSLLSTSNINTLPAALIVNQPAPDFVAAMSGKLPGLITTQSSGMPGAKSTIEIRGANSIYNSREPLIIVDGIPFGPNNFSVSNIPSGNAGGSLSALPLIPMTDIESITVLKDADATAIYGARGANGVILINTNTARPGKQLWDIQFFSGVSTVTRRPKLMNMSQYKAMREEAFKYDGIKPDLNNAPELLAWDTTRSTDWGRQLIGGVAHATHAQVSYSGGNNNTSYLLASSYRQESNVFPGHLPHRLITIHGSLQYNSPDGRWRARISGLAGWDWNRQVINDLSQFQFLVPNAPSLIDSAGRLVFYDKGVYLNNPLSYTRYPYEAISGNLLGNTSISYSPFRWGTLVINAGYNNVHDNETSQIPISAQDPASDPTASSYFATTGYRSWIFDPRIQIRDSLGLLVINFLAGTTLQGQHSSVSTLSASGFTSDAFLSMISSAPDLRAYDKIVDYHYSSLYGRMNFNWANKYLLNFTFSRDGSSRFGPDKQMGNFGATGLAWIFSGEKFFREHLPFLSLGKFKGSYGITGNDQIGDYGYLATWSSTTGSSPYQGIPGFYPSGPANPELSWETIRKLEFALDLGFFRDRLTLSAAWYRNRSSNQLLPYILPRQTGFNTELYNSPAIVENSGWEVVLNKTGSSQHKVRWTSSVNINFPRNRLVSFPDLPNTTYASTLVIGQSINVVKAYSLTGVDPQTGVFRYASKSGDNRPVDSDRVVVGQRDLSCYGGVYNSVRAGHWELALQAEFRFQENNNYQAELYQRNPPGMAGLGLTSNQTTAMLDRWHQPGDRAPYQVPTTTTATEAGKALSYYNSSSGILANTSFLRIKTLSLSYYLPDKWRKKMHCQDGQLFLRGQNLVTVTGYKDVDPEVHSALVLPPMRTIEIGFHFSF